MQYFIYFYIKNLSQNKVQFLCAKNKIVNKNLEKKSTALLEALAIELGVKLLHDISAYYEKSIIKINISTLVLFTDSTICISWIRLLVYKFDELKKRMSC